MGAALPIVGAITGVAGAVSQISNQDAQASAQQQQIDAQRQALQLQGASTQANMQLQLNDLARKQMYSSYQNQINQIQQQATRQQDEQNIALQKLSVQNQQAASTFGAQAGQAQAGILASQQSEGAAKSLYQDDSAANNEYAAQLQGGINEFTKLGNEGRGLGRQLKGDEEGQGQIAMAMASKQQGNINLQDNASTNPFTDATGANVLRSRQDQMLNAIQDYTQKFNNVSGDVLHQLAYSKDFTDLLKQYGMTNFQDTLGNIARGQDFANAQGNLTIQGANAQANLAQQSLDQAQSQREQQFGIQTAQDNLNQTFYDVSNQAQGTAVQQQSAGQLAQQRAQVLGLDAQNPQGVGVLGLASAGLGLYNSVSGIFNQPSVSQSTTFSLSNQPGSLDGGVFGSPSADYNTGDYGFISGGSIFNGS